MKLTQTNYSYYLFLSCCVVIRYLSFSFRVLKINLSLFLSLASQCVIGLITVIPEKNRLIELVNKHSTKSLVVDEHFILYLKVIKRSRNIQRIFSHSVLSLQNFKCRRLIYSIPFSILFPFRLICLSKTESLIHLVLCEGIKKK